MTHHWEQSAAYMTDCVGESQNTVLSKRSHDFIYTKSKVQPDLTRDVLSWGSGYEGWGQQLEGDKCECWDACGLFCDPGADLALCENQVSFILLMCTFSCTVYFSTNFTLFPLHTKKLWNSYYQPNTSSRECLAQWEKFVECFES